MMFILVVVLAVILIVAASIVLCRRKKNISATLPHLERAIVTLRDVISFFKQPEVLALLKQSEDYIAVAIREKLNTGKYRLVLCIFSKKTSSIIQPLSVVETPSLDQELLGLFGEKNMIVLNSEVKR